MPGAFESATIGRGRYLRPTQVLPRAYAGQVLGLQITGLRETLLIPEELRAAYESMLLRLEGALTTMARSVVPGGPTGKLARQVHARRVGPNRIVIGTFGSQFARALDRGFTSTPKKARALRFEDQGELVFTHRVKVAGRHFYEKWLASTPPIVEAIYDASFYDIKVLM